MPIPNYINPNPKPVSLSDLKRVLKEANAKRNAQRSEDNQHLANILRDGFYCTGGKSNITPLI